MKFELTVLGSNSAVPANGRNLSAQVLNIQHELLLIDCGEGTQWQILKYKIKYGRINHIFISHLHGDHIFGLIGLLSTYALNGRKRPLHIYAPEGLDLIIDVQLRLTQMELPYPLHFHKTNPSRSELILDTPKFTVHTIPLQHRVPCNGYLFREKHTERRINMEEVRKYDIPNKTIGEIKAGADFVQDDDTVITYEALTLPPARERSFAYCSDTVYTESISKLIEGVDLLYHEATFMHDLLEKAEKTMHTTALQAAMLAKKAKAKRLLIGHFSSRYHDVRPLEQEARTLFAATNAVIEGRTYSAPL